MNWARRCYLIAPLLALAVVLAGSGCALQRRQSAATAAQQLASAYRMSALLAQAAPAVSGSLNRNLSQSVDLARRKRVDVLVNRAFAAAPLQAGAVRRLAARARREGRTKDLVQAAVWLDQPLARRMVALERKVGEPGFRRGFKDFVAQPAGDQRKRRLQIVDQLAGDMHLADLQTRFNITLLGAMIRARNLAVDGANRVDESQIRRILSNTRTGLHRKLAQQLPLMLLYVYRNVDTATLERYAAFEHRPAMVWVNQAVVRAIGETLEAAGRSIPTTLKTKDR